MARTKGLRTLKSVTVRHKKAHTRTIKTKSGGSRKVSVKSGKSYTYRKQFN